MVELNQYQQEIEKLLTLQEKKTSKQLYNLYVDTIKDLKKALLVDYQNFENLSRSQRMDLTRAEALLETLERRSEMLSDGLGVIIPDHLKKTGEMSFNALFYEYEQTRGGISFALLNETALETIIETPVAGFRLSDRLKGNAESLRQDIKNEMTRAFLHGDSYQRAAKRLSVVGQSSYARAMRIMRTESGRVSAVSRQRSQDEADKLGIAFEKVWVSVLDARTRHTHAMLDGQTRAPKEYFDHGGLKTLQPHMFGIASEDVNCRCTSISRLKGDDTPLLRRDNETGEVVEYKNYQEWEKAINRRQFSISSNSDYLKASKSVKPIKDKKESIKAEGVSFSGRKVLNSSHNLYVSDSLGSARKAFSYYEKQAEQVLTKINVPEGTPKPRIVLYHAAKDLGRKNNFGAFDPATNTVFIDASKSNTKAILDRLKKSNESWKRRGNIGKVFAVDDDSLSPMAHEFGHYKHYWHVQHHADSNGVTYAESKAIFNEKLLDFLKTGRYNIGEDISGYAEKHLKRNLGNLSATNEIISESSALSLLSSDKKAIKIIQFLEKEEW